MTENGTLLLQIIKYGVLIIFNCPDYYSQTEHPANLKLESIILLKDTAI